MRILFLIFSFLLFADAYGQSVLKITEAQDFYIPKSMDYKILSIDSADYKKILLSRDFKNKYGRQYFDKHGLTNVVWLRTQLQTTQLTEEEWLFVVDNPLLDDLTFYIFSEGKLLQSYRSGDALPFDMRPVKVRSLVFPIQLLNEKEYTILIRVNMSGRPTSPVLLVTTKDRFFVWEMNKRNELAAFYGFVAVLSIVTLYLAWIFKDKVFTWLSLFCLTLFLTYFCVGGFANMYVYPNNPGLGQKIPGMLVFLNCFCSIGFCRAFVKEILNKKLIDRILLGCMVLSMLLCLISFGNLKIVYVTGWLLYRFVPLSYLILLVTSALSIKKSYASTWIFSLGLFFCVNALAYWQWSDFGDGYIFTSGYSLLAFSVGCAFITFSTIDRLRILKEYEKEIQVKTEREMIAKDLHDNIGTRLTSVSLSLNRLSAKTENPGAIENIQEQTDQIISQLRETIWVMDKQIITFEDLGNKIRNLFWQMRSLEISLELEWDEKLHSIKLQSIIAVNIFRIIQESIQNSLKHSNTKDIMVQLLEIPEGTFVIKVIDYGKGFKYSESNQTSGYGLSNMRKRATEMKLGLKIDSIENEGTTISINLPITRQF
jgi:two-component sensor histidine kinase